MDAKSNTNNSTQETDNKEITNSADEITEDTIKELDEELTEYLKDELGDVSKYVNLSKNAPEDYKAILVSIAKEERTHAQLIEEILKDMCKFNFSKEINDLKKKADEDLESV